MSGKRAGSSLKYFSEDSTGFKIQPKTVLIMSLVYIGLVVLLHIYSKVNAPAAKVEGPGAQSEQAENGQQQEAYTEENL